MGSNVKMLIFVVITMVNLHYSLGDALYLLSDYIVNKTQCEGLEQQRTIVTPKTFECQNMIKNGDVNLECCRHLSVQLDRSLNATDDQRNEITCYLLESDHSLRCHPENPACIRQSHKVFQHGLAVLLAQCKELAIKTYSECNDMINNDHANSECCRLMSDQLGPESEVRADQRAELACSVARAMNSGDTPKTPHVSERFTKLLDTCLPSMPHNVTCT